MKAEDSLNKVNGRDDLSALFPQIKTIEIAGEKVELTEATYRAGQGFISRWLAILALCGEGDDEMNAVEDHPDEVTALLVVALGESSREWIAGLSVFDRYEIINAWLEHNRDFFARLFKAKPQRAGITNTLIAMSSGAGPMPSTSSPSTATTSTNSSREPPTVTSKPSRARKSASGLNS